MELSTNSGSVLEGVEERTTSRHVLRLGDPPGLILYTGWKYPEISNVGSDGA